MEESEKRRERLRAMRLEATTQVVSSSSSSFPQQTLNSVMQQPLSNPLLDNQDFNAAAATPPPRFDFYTDPLAAYSADKRRPFTPRPHFSPSSSGAMNPERPPSGVHQFQNNYAPRPGMYQGGNPYYSAGPPSSPMGFRSPYPHQGSPNFSNAPSRGHPFNNTPSPGPGCGSPYPEYQGNPNFRSPQGRDPWSNNSPSPGPGCGGGPSPCVGGGRGRWDGGRVSPSSRFSGRRGRGRGYQDCQTRSFYSKSMVEDPWESLTPVIWQGEKENEVRSFRNNRGSLQKTPTFQRTPDAKKARVSNPFDASNSNKSLAEYLAESFDEAVEDAAATT